MGEAIDDGHGPEQSTGYEDPRARHPVSLRVAPPGPGPVALGAAGVPAARPPYRIVPPRNAPKVLSVSAGHHEPCEDHTRPHSPGNPNSPGDARAVEIATERDELRVAVIVHVGVALVRQPDVREGRQEWRVVGVDAVAEQVVRGAVRHAEDRVEGRSVTLDEGAELDIGHVVHETPAVGEAAQIAIDGAEPARGAAIRDTEDASPRRIRLDARVD